MYFHLQAAIRKEFSKLDSDNSGFITKGILLINRKQCVKRFFPDEMLAVIAAGFTGDKVGISVSSVLHFVYVQMDEVKAAIDKLDVDKDGKVSYPEFILVMKYKK